MTAEVGIINQRGVALAADSAVTISKANGEVITLNNANKLFTLSPLNRVGIMIYGNASFMDIPLDVLINSYSEKTAKETKPALKNYVESLLRYLKDLNIYKKESEETFVIQNAYAALKELPDNPQSVDDIETALYKLQKEYNDTVINVDFNNFQKKYFEQVKSVFLTKYSTKAFVDLFQLFLQVVAQIIASSASLSNSSTGLVIAGYGNEELFPSVYHLNLIGRYDNQIKYTVEDIKCTDPITGKVSSGIMPFARREMVDTVLNGIDPTLKDVITNELVKIHQYMGQYLDENYGQTEETKELKEYLGKSVERRYRELDDIIKANYIQPIIAMLNNLSLQELGQMAHTLVNLTSFKRKFSGDLRTVGGPIDVLVVSRKDGAQWLTDKKTNKIFNHF